MKTLKKILSAFLILMSAESMFAQRDTTIKIKTSSQCEQCKKRLENSLSFEKGVKSIVLDIDTKEITVKYNPQKTNAEKLKIAISKTGYDADEIPADKKAYDKLPSCCQKPK